MIRNIIVLILYSQIASSFTNIDRWSLEKAKLQKLEHRALQNTIGRIYVYDITGRKDCNKTRIKYLGIVHTNKGKYYKILTSFFVFSAAATCHGSSSIKVFDIKNRYVGEYFVGTSDDLPDALRKNKLVYLSNIGGCNMRKTRSIDLRKGLPKSFFIECSKKMGDIYNFSSGD
jgi:hypothetical protein